MPLENIINNETSIPRKGLFSRLKNKIAPYILSLSILAGAYVGYSPASFAQEKVKTEKQSKKLKIPDWLNLYLDMGYIHGENYHLKSEIREGDFTPKGNWQTLNLDIKGKNVFDISIGAGIFPTNSPIFFDVSISNLYDGLKKKHLISEREEQKQVLNESEQDEIVTSLINLDASYPFISYSAGLVKGNSNYIFNASFSYSTNIDGKNKSILKNRAFSASISRLYKNFVFTISNSFLKKNLAHNIPLSENMTNHYDINENMVNLEFIISHRFNHFTPYILYSQSFHNKVDNTQSIEENKTIQTTRTIPIKYSDKNTGIFKIGIHFSTSNMLGLFKGINGSIFHQSNIIEKTVVHTYTYTGPVTWKPNIYLYPEEDQAVKVKLNEKNNSRITESIPKYNNGWEVFVDKNGRIDENFSYLFYEGHVPEANHLKKGWCINKQNIMPFFENVLSEYGFNNKEIDDFTEHWSTHLPEGKYYEVYPIVDEGIDKYFVLDITPKPDSVRRLWFYVVPTDRMKNIKSPEVKEFSREGFTVTEWGVVLK